MEFCQYKVIQSMMDSPLIPKGYIVVWEGDGEVPIGWEERPELHKQLQDILTYDAEQLAKNPLYRPGWY